MADGKFNSESLKQIVDALAEELRPVLREYGYMPNGYDSYVSAHVSRDRDGAVRSVADLHLPSGFKERLTASEWDNRCKHVKSIILMAWGEIEDLTPTEDIRPLLDFVADGSQDNDGVWNVTIKLEFLVHGLPLVFSYTHFSPR